MPDDIDAAVAGAKRAMLALLAHDVRAPLSVVITGLAELRATKPAFDDYQASVFRHVCSGAETTLQLLQDAYDLAQLDAGLIALTCLPLDVRGVVAAVVARAAATELSPSKHAVRIATDLPETVVVAVVDETWFAQALGAVLRHARAHARSEVRVALRTTASAVTVVVDDDLPASTTATRAAIFDRAHPDARTGGPGLSLVVARMLIELHGGTLDATAREDAGARLSVQLPRG